MKRGFTILELLVASLLLGMLVSVLTMLFNQSSISWRTGVASVESLDDVRKELAMIREEADNAYVWTDGTYYLLGIWDENGDLRTRAWDVDEEDGAIEVTGKLDSLNVNTKLNEFPIDVDVASSGGAEMPRSYLVNVKSAGPNKVFGDYDDIWSSPDAIEIE